MKLLAINLVLFHIFSLISDGDTTKYSTSILLKPSPSINAENALSTKDTTKNLYKYILNQYSGSHIPKYTLPKISRRKRSQNLENVNGTKVHEIIKNSDAICNLGQNYSDCISINTNELFSIEMSSEESNNTQSGEDEQFDSAYSDFSKEVKTKDIDNSTKDSSVQVFESNDISSKSDNKTIVPEFYSTEVGESRSFTLLLVLNAILLDLMVIFLIFPPAIGGVALIGIILFCCFCL